MMTSGRLLKTRAVAAILMVTGAGPQLNVITPPAATAFTTAAEVQLAGVPLPTTWSGEDASASPASGGTGAVPDGLPAIPSRLIDCENDVVAWTSVNGIARVAGSFSARLR